MKHYYISAIFLFIFSACVYGQQENGANRVTLPSIQNPQAASLGKFGMYPVAEYTGVIPINIPLFEIDVKGYKIPFSLSYHASGIKLQQMETEVGLGWSLSGIGVISRSVIGVPDEKTMGSYNIVPKTAPQLISEASGATSQSDIMTKRVRLRAITEGKGEDTHTDIYFYNLPKASGKFIVNNKNQYYTIPYAPIKIDRGTVLSNLYNSYPFILKDDEGAVYEFNSYTYSVPDNFEPLQGNAIISSWYVDKISLPHYNEVVDFQYNEVFNLEETMYQEQSIGYSPNADGSLTALGGSISLSPGNINHKTYLVSQITYGNGKVVFNYKDSPNLTVSRSKFLDEILIYNKANELVKKLTFKYEIPSSRVKLTAVTTVDLTNPTLSGVYKISYNNLHFPGRNNGYGFQSDYWGYYNSGGNTSFIPSVQVKKSSIGVSSVAPWGYQQEQTYSVGSANRAVDTNFNRAEMISKIVYPTGGYTEFVFESNRIFEQEIISPDVTHWFGGGTSGKGSATKSENVYLFSYEAGNVAKYNTQPKLNLTFGPPTPINGAVRDYTQLVTLKDLTTNAVLLTKWHDANPSLPLQFSKDLSLEVGHNYELKVTIYGVSSYTNGYMTSTVDASVSWVSNANILGDVEKIVGGQRIKSIKSYNHDGVLVNSEEYRYGTNESGVGTSLFDPKIFYKNYLDQKMYTFWSAPGNMANPTRRVDYWQRKYFGISEYSSVGLNGCPAFYSQVTRYTHSNNGTSKFKEVRNYKLNNSKTYESVDYLNSKNYGAYSFLLFNPVPVSEISYNSLNQPVFKKERSYSYFKGAVFTPTLVFEDYYFEVPTYALPGGYILEPNISTEFRFTGSNLRTEVQLPIKELEKMYTFSNGIIQDSIIQTKDFEYTAAYVIQPSLIKQSDSRSGVTQIRNYYPDDISSTTLNGGNLTAEQLSAIQLLKNNSSHRVAMPIQAEVYNNSSLVSMQRNLYGNFSGQSRLSKVIEKKGLSSSFNTLADYLSYDTYGNPLEIKQKEGASAVYLWGYNGQYPIAKIENATYAQVLAALGSNSSTIISQLNSATVSEALVRSTVQTLRTALTNALVTTYTYKPLVGMTSATDPSGRTTYYNYDGFGRLKETKDTQSKTTGTYEYHYR
ncbi:MULTISPECIES: RHS repeat domain-containing protein [Olivibacter]|jgi:YD repeat-containing protein|uniref:RHS repeat domain-containing protein n=1 Tax=Olivibacter oleidegradans TaxID=760123 RepID=A0ABV6HGD5_9SPHI|nr:RHS repeat domain-containing protein [Olivibacter jilunii]